MPVHGPFPGTVEADVEHNSDHIINGRRIQFIAANAPEDIDYNIYDINDALIVDNTGAFRDETALSRHFEGQRGKQSATSCSR
ncbi:MAG: glyceraldehyde 3-phosphate dehydrogenase NAD-binding domain-containing protein [Owenweeksia sp.]|nr:glyceraldehyde 3-phosphate dehydrogenase NAD-binding domain-containing protein [Owenweeksia sp.]